jgi:hypothetical protein
VTSVFRQINHGDLCVQTDVTMVTSMFRQMLPW